MIAPIRNLCPLFGRRVKRVLSQINRDHIDTAPSSGASEHVFRVRNARRAISDPPLSFARQSGRRRQSVGLRRSPLPTYTYNGRDTNGMTSLRTYTLSTR